jgi:Winged helix-turn helix
MAAEQTLEALLDVEDPQARGSAATNWTVPLLRSALAKQGWSASQRTLRRTVHRLGSRWKRPKFVLGRPDPASAEKQSRGRASGSRGDRGRRSLVRRWDETETTRREFPPLRAAWATVGQQRVVVISGRTGRRVIHGARNAASGELVSLVRERSRQDECSAFVETRGHRRLERPKLLVSR